ncbi:MAG: hypothetical protein IPM29_23015 [Planctomycetes bacterium]|nr:hypothetical protein [Planctomycetota bacterium]
MFATVKLFFAGLAVLAAGIVLILQPGDLGEEIVREVPAATEIGAACVAFGGLMLVVVLLQAAAPKSRLAHVARSLMGAVACTALAVGITYAVLPRVITAAHIATDGVVTTARVVGQRGVNRGGRFLVRLTVDYDGHRGAVVVPGNPAARTASVDVIYAASTPADVLPWRGERGFVALLDESIGLWPAGLALLAVLVFGGFGLAQAVALFQRPRASDEPA